MFCLTDFILTPSACIGEFRQRERRNLLPLFLFLILLVPLAHSFAVALGRGSGIEAFARDLLAGYWAKVIFFTLFNLLTSGLVFFIASLTQAGLADPKPDRGADAVLFLVLFLASWLPLSFMPAVMLVAAETGTFGQVLAALGWTAVFIWILLLQISVVRGIFGLTRIRSALVCAAAMLLVLLLDCLFFYLAVLSAVGVG